MTDVAVTEPIRILVVDDEDQLRRNTRRHLERAGYECADAPDAVAARELLDQESFDLLLCDVKMPGENGLDLVRWVSTAHPHVCSVMVTGLDDTNTAEEALDHGAVGYVVKPFERNELLIAVKNALHHQALSVEHARQRDQLEKLVEIRANFDLLTGLANREHFTRRLELLLQSPLSTSTAVLFCGLDHFKVINDSLGHSAGDRVLESVAERIRDRISDQELAARFGGDLFAVFISTATVPVQQRVEELLEILAWPHELEDHRLVVTVSIGVVPDLTSYGSAEMVLRDADAAVNQAKVRGRGSSQFVDEGIQAQARKRFDIETGLRQAIDHGDLVVHYQPQFRLTDLRLTGFEALVRWNHPELGLVFPDEFIPVAEESVLIWTVGRIVLDQACIDLLAFREILGESDPLPVMSVNVSASHLSRGSLARDVADVLDRHQLDGADLCVEITESVLLEGNTEVNNNLDTLQELGVRVSIDDFGTGYSSLSYISRLPIDEIKIDRSFILDISQPEGAKLVTGIIGLATPLANDLVAEGIETSSQFEFLYRNGCGHGQGFLLGRPIDREATETWLRAGAQAQVDLLPLDLT